jgi:cob(I)alamin adenosyltransferase
VVKINRIYTRQGDGGETHLVGGRKVAKDSLRVITYGEVDELNSWIGYARTLAESAREYALMHELAEIQQELFDVGSELATAPGDEWEKMVHISEAQIERLEKTIDLYADKVPELKSFVLPGGTTLNAILHLARTVCRRAERSCWQLSRSEKVYPLTLIYLNRLSDLLFAMARGASLIAGVPEYLWDPSRKRT